MPEEEAFYVLLKLMENYRLRELYKPAMTDLGLCMFQLECLVQETMPDLHMHFRNMGFDTSMYASSWFLTLFATQLPLELANRIMDVFMSECFQRDLTPKFEQDHDLLMSTAYNIKYNHKKLKKLEKDYLTKKIKEQEEAVELRRLRTENRLLRQRVEYLEQESSALADRLIDRQVFLAQEAENSVNIKHDMLTLREMNAETHRRLEEAYETIRELTNNSREGFKDAKVQVDDKTMIEHIHTLQQDLIEVRSREADHENTIRDLKNRIHETELAYKRLKETPPDHCVAGLQEELIAVKMREAEANLSLKEMRQKITDLQSHWEKYIALTSNTSINLTQSSSKVDPETKYTSSTPPAAAAGQTSNVAFRDLQDQLMGVRLREAETAVELKEMRQRVMELETQNHVCTNQIRRQDDEYKKLQSELDVALGRERDVINQLNDVQHKLQDKESQLQEHLVMSKLKETELLTSIAELRNKIAEFERKSCEKWTREELNKGDEDDFVSGIKLYFPCRVVLFGARGRKKFSSLINSLIISFDCRQKNEITSTENAFVVRTPTSLTASYANIETSSVCSDADFAAYLAEMAVKIPPEAQSCFDKTLTMVENCSTTDNNVNDPHNQCSSSGEESVSTLKNGTTAENLDYRRPKVLATE
uniref:Rab-GAP TBC domain-containing protein n=1 Tax=Romanomermis culicivorax TaxID=13658 RepID=A0A915JKH1_ROMCU